MLIGDISGSANGHLLPATELSFQFDGSCWAGLRASPAQRTLECASCGDGVRYPAKAANLWPSACAAGVP